MAEDIFAIFVSLRGIFAIFPLFNRITKIEHMPQRCEESTTLTGIMASGLDRPLDDIIKEGKGRSFVEEDRS